MVEVAPKPVENEPESDSNGDLSMPEVESEIPVNKDNNNEGNKGLKIEYTKEYNVVKVVEVSRRSKEEELGVNRMMIQIES